ncbi:hypothetical protein GCM10018787_53680 [Streptomyces thermodiastaticus]|nr:hypothetical protein GCM10018787_53680 [Streptomyces thermodiastaticus]
MSVLSAVPGPAPSKVITFFPAAATFNLPGSSVPLDQVRIVTPVRTGFGAPVPQRAVLAF